MATDGMDDTLGPNDAVFMVDTEGPLRGRALQFLSAPTGCEVCGPAFTPDNRTFFVAIQHPGLVDKATYANPGAAGRTTGRDMPPRPSVVAIYREDRREGGRPALGARAGPTGPARPTAAGATCREGRGSPSPGASDGSRAPDGMPARLPFRRPRACGRRCYNRQP